MYNEEETETVVAQPVVAITKLRPRDGDMLFVRMEDHPSAAELARLRELLESIVPEGVQTVVITSDDVSVGVVRAVV